MTQARGIHKIWAVGIVAGLLIAATAGFMAFRNPSSGEPQLVADSESPAPSASAQTDPAQTDPAETESAQPDAAVAGGTEAGAQAALPEANPQPPVAFDEEPEFRPGFSATVVSMRAIDGIGRGIGEISGPSVAFEFSVTNETSEPMATVGFVVNCYDSTGAPALPLYGDSNADALPDQIPPGATVTGVYVFNIPTDLRDPVTLAISYDAAMPTLVFKGAAPK